jgi:hypothetical protein
MFIKLSFYQGRHTNGRTRTCGVINAERLGVFGRLSVETPAILAGDCRGFSQFHQANKCRNSATIRRPPILPESFTMHHSSSVALPSTPWKLNINSVVKQVTGNTISCCCLSLQGVWPENSCWRAQCITNTKNSQVNWQHTGGCDD